MTKASKSNDHSPMVKIWPVIVILSILFSGALGYGFDSLGKKVDKEVFSNFRQDTNTRLDKILDVLLREKHGG